MASVVTFFVVLVLHSCKCVSGATCTLEILWNEVEHTLRWESHLELETVNHDVMRELDTVSLEVNDGPGVSLASAIAHEHEQCREKADFQDGTWPDHYTSWQRARVVALENALPVDFWRGKSVLELGCGEAFFSTYALRQGAVRTVAVDGREVYVDRIRREKPEVDARHVDCDDPNAIRALLAGEHFDILIHFGLLYHLTRVDEHLLTLLEGSPFAHVILETEVIDTPDDVVLLVREEEIGDQGLKLEGARPSPSRVERLLRERGYSNARLITDPALEQVAFHSYNWESQTGNGTYWGGAHETKISWRLGLRRLWIAIRETNRVGYQHRDTLLIPEKN